MERRDPDAAAAWLKRLIAARSVAVVPAEAERGCEIVSLNVAHPNGDPLFGLHRIRMGASLIAAAEAARTLLLAFPEPDGQLRSVSQTSGRGGHLYAHRDEHVAHVPGRSAFLALSLHPFVIDRLCAGAPGPSQPSWAVVRLITFGRKERVERVARALWAEAQGAAADAADRSGFAERAWRRLEAALLADMDDHRLGRVEFDSPPRQAVLRQCQEVLSTLRGRAVSSRELSRLTGHSPQRIHDCFSTLLGVGPRDWHALQRLGDVRRRLRRASPHADSVGRIAASHGFRHLGRFADLYQRTFEEYPSATLRYGAAE